MSLNRTAYFYLFLPGSLALRPRVLIYVHESIFHLFRIFAEILLIQQSAFPNDSGLHKLHIQLVLSSTPPHAEGMTRLFLWYSGIGMNGNLFTNIVTVQKVQTFSFDPNPIYRWESSLGQTPTNSHQRTKFCSNNEVVLVLDPTGPRFELLQCCFFDSLDMEVLVVSLHTKKKYQR